MECSSTRGFLTHRRTAQSTGAHSACSLIASQGAPGRWFSRTDGLDRADTRSSSETASATATSTAPAATIPAMSVSGEVATARIASAASHSDRDCGTRASASYGKKDLAEEQRRRAEREEREASVASSSSPGWAMASS
jgi:hypothetical protein